MKIKKLFSWIPLEKDHLLKDLTGGERGSLTLSLALLITVFALFLTLSYKKFMMIHLENLQRKKTYLCLKSTLDRYDNHLTFIKRTNLSIQVINASMLAHPTPYLVQLKRVIQKIQEVKSLWVYSKAITQRACEGLQKTFPLMAFPLKKRGIAISRHLSGTVQIKKKAYKFKLPSYKSFPFLFLITGRVSFDPKIQVSHSREIPFSLYHHN
jgi:hypothetical protein